MAENSKMEELLMKHLSNPNVDKTALKSYSAHLSTQKSDKLKIERIWWNGIPNPEEFNIQFRVPIDYPDLLSILLSREVSTIFVTSIGTVNPEAFQATVSLRVNQIAQEKGQII